MPTKNVKQATHYEDWQNEVPEGWVEDAVGFPPYWNPEVGKSFRGVVMNKDARDPDFIRYTIQATEELLCKKGPSDDAEDVIVNAGELFTCSAYAALPLDTYFAFEVKVVTFKTRKLPGNEASQNRPRDLFEFKVLVAPDTKKLLADLRKNDAERLREMVKEARLEAIKIQMDAGKKAASKMTAGKTASGASATAAE